MASATRVSHGVPIPRSSASPSPVATATRSSPGTSTGTTSVATSASASSLMRLTISCSGSRLPPGERSTPLISAEASSHCSRRADSSYKRAFSIAIPAVAAIASTRSSSSAVNSPPVRSVGSGCRRPHSGSGSHPQEGSMGGWPEENRRTRVVADHRQANGQWLPDQRPSTPRPLGRSPILVTVRGPCPDGRTLQLTIVADNPSAA
jgi:hypothetical protein